MRVIRKALVTGGLVILTGPLCFMVSAQDYVDVEAERASQGPSSGATSSTTTVAPAPNIYGPTGQSKSYGINTAPPAPGSGAVASSGQRQNMGTLVLQIQQLRQDVMRLNGIVEEQSYELRRLKEQNLERYVDLDKRLSALSSGGGVPSGGQAETSTANVIPRSGVTSGGSVTEQPGEGEAYRAAYALVRGQEFNQAVKAFQQFLRDYPDGKYAPNAHYWLGELFLVVDPQDLESSRQSFMLLVTQYPDHPKVPDALYKLGKVHFLKGNRDKAREYLEGVTKAYPDSSAARLSKDFLAENF